MNKPEGQIRGEDLDEHTPCDCECHGPKPLPSLRERALRVIEVAFGGEHHVGRIRWGGTERYPDCKFSVYGTMASWDDSRLTRLVVAAHDECVRAAVRPMPQGLVVELSDRWRTGKNTIADTCPTLEAHVAAIRGGRAAIMELCESMREP